MGEKPALLDDALENELIGDGLGCKEPCAMVARFGTGLSEGAANVRRGWFHRRRDASLNGPKRLSIVAYIAIKARGVFE
jgi:hypothetical protein